ncbi:hypothetical protein LTR17_015923 [Elasticomyces elasticus]|nr:hypothetical protein LTR17_015923 [Elasticomyces elasticus]
MGLGAFSGLLAMFLNLAIGHLRHPNTKFLQTTNMATSTSTLQTLATEMAAVVNTAATNTTAPAHSIVEMAADAAWMGVRGIGFAMGAFVLLALLFGTSIITVVIISQIFFQGRSVDKDGKSPMSVVILLISLVIDITMSIWVGTGEYGPKQPSFLNVLSVFAAGTAGVIANQVGFVLLVLLAGACMWVVRRVRRGGYQAISTEEDGNVQQGGETEKSDLTPEPEDDEQKGAAESADHSGVEGDRL